MPIARVRPVIDRPLSIGIQCHHCNDAPCVAACLTGAMSIDEETGKVVHDLVKCIGCWTCVMVCPFGAIVVSESQKVPAKCDLCPELKIPACVANCPNEALTFDEVADQ